MGTEVNLSRFTLFQSHNLAPEHRLLVLHFAVSREKQGTLGRLGLFLK